MVRKMSLSFQSNLIVESPIVNSSQRLMACLLGELANWPFVIATVSQCLYSQNNFKVTNPLKVESKNVAVEGVMSQLSESKTPDLQTAWNDRLRQ